MHFLKQLPFQLGLSMVLAFFLGSWIPLEGVNLFYTLSRVLIDLLLSVLPLIVFSLMLRALLQSAGSSLWLICLLFIGITASNFVALCFAYGVSLFFLPIFALQSAPDLTQLMQSSVRSLFTLTIPKLIGTEIAMILGIGIGVMTNWLPSQSSLKSWIEEVSSTLHTCVFYFLNSLVIPLLPFYVFGFCLKLSYDNTLLTLIAQYGKVFFLNSLLVASYLFMLYWVGSGFSFKRALENIRAMLPAGMTGFSTMSSAVTMPVTLHCVTQTTRSKDFAQLVVPATANIHMLGDDITITMMALMLMSLFGMPWPDMMAFIPFAFAFSFAKLSCVGVPGASVMVVLPVLQVYLGFSPEMITLVTTLYVLQDAFGTGFNVMGNGAFALILQRCLAYFNVKGAIQEAVTE